MDGIKKPTTAVRDAEVSVRKTLGMHVPADPRRGFTDRMEALSPSVMIGYKNYGTASNYPTPAMKAAAVDAANLAGRIMRKANDAFAGIAFLRKNESALMTQVLDKHFRLTAGDLAGGMLTGNVRNKSFAPKDVIKHDRRWVIEKIREKMLSISFHLNTGVYLIDLDASRRDIRVGATANPANADQTEEAFTGAQKKHMDNNTWRPTQHHWSNSLTCGFKHGEIHVSLANVATYSAISYARVIIHEATHKYLNTDDPAYAWDPAYPTLSLSDTLRNADSFSWAAVSLYCGSLKMDDPSKYATDWKNCTKP
jgi:hypothetical protein